MILPTPVTRQIMRRVVPFPVLPAPDDCDFVMHVSCPAFVAPAFAGITPPDDTLNFGPQDVDVCHALVLML